MAFNIDDQWSYLSAEDWSDFNQDLFEDPPFNDSYQHAANIQQPTTAEQAADVQQLTGAQPAATSIQQAANVQQAGNVQNASNVQPDTNEQLANENANLKNMLVLNALAELDELKRQYAQAMETFQHGSTRIGLLQNILTLMVQPGGALPANDATSTDLLNAQPPSTNNAASIDLSRDPHSGAQARWAAQKASENAHPRNSIDPNSLHYPTAEALQLPGDFPPFVQNYPGYHGFQPDPPPSSNASGSRVPAKTPRASRASDATISGPDSTAASAQTSSASSKAPTLAPVTKSSTAQPTSSSIKPQARKVNQPSATSSKVVTPGPKRISSTSDKPQVPKVDLASASTHSTAPSGSRKSRNTSLSAQISTSGNGRVARTDKNVERASRPSSKGQAASRNPSPPAAKLPVSARANGPTNVVEGMIPGADEERLLPLQRATLPKGNVNNNPYACEARCGYPDWAGNMIQCDSAYHKQFPRLRRTDGDEGSRGWYHRGCCGLDPSSAGPDDGWICPPCQSRKKSTTTNDDNDDDGHDGSDPGSGDDSGDEYNPGPGTPDEDSSADEDGNDDQDDGDYDDNKTTNNKKNSGQRKNTAKNKKRYILDDSSDDDADGDADDGNVGANTKQAVSNAAINSDVQNQPYPALFSTVFNPILQLEQRQPLPLPTLRAIPTNPQPQPQPTSPNPFLGQPTGYGITIPWKTDYGDPWLEEERILAMAYMHEIQVAKIIKGEARFVEIARRLKSDGYNRDWIPVKNQWNRYLRERSAIDERKNKRAPLSTSKQDKETKRKNKEAREKKEAAKAKAREEETEWDSEALLDLETLTRESSGTPKRRYATLGGEEDGDGDGDEVVPRKRRRESPWEGDFFGGLP